VLALFFTVLLRLAYGVPALSSASFFLACYAFIYCPGRAVLRLARVDESGASGLALSLTAGLCATPILYTVARMVGAPRSIFAVVVPAVVHVVWTDVRHLRVRSPPPLIAVSRQLAAPVIAVGVLTAVLHLSHFSDLKVQPGGGFLLRDHFMTETVFHLGVINMAKGEVPPPYPFASGYSLPYHVDMHVLAEMFSRFAGVDTLLGAYFYLPLLFSFLLVFVAGVFFFELVPNVGVATAFGLMMFGADFSFIPGLLLRFPTEYPWTLIFKTTIWGLLTLNGILPALSIMFGFFILYRRYAMQARSSLFLLTLLAVGAFRMKSSTGAHLLACGIASAIYGYARDRTSRWLFATAAFVLGGAIAVADLLFRGNPTEVVTRAVVAPFTGFTRTIEQLAIARPSLADLHSLALCLLFLVYVTGFLGVRVVMFRHVAALVRARTTPPPFDGFLLLFCLAGPVIAEFLYLGGPDGINMAEWFAIESIFAATIYFASWFAKASQGRRGWIATVVCLIGMAPTTVNLLMLRGGGTYFEITPDEVGAAAFLERSTPAGSVVLEFPRETGLSIAAHLAGRQTVLGTYRSFLFSTVGAAAIDQRRNDISAFVGGASPAARTAILERYRVSYVLVPTAWAAFLADQLRLTPVYGHASIAVLERPRPIPQS
jgi:hypothetical protein